MSGGVRRWVNVQKLGMLGRSGWVMRKGNMIMDVEMWRGWLIGFDEKTNVIYLVDIHKG